MLNATKDDDVMTSANFLEMTAQQLALTESLWLQLTDSIKPYVDVDTCTGNNSQPLTI